MSARKRELKYLDNCGEAPELAKRKKQTVQPRPDFFSDNFRWKAAKNNEVFMNYVTSNLDETRDLMLEAIESSTIVGVAAYWMQKLDYEMRTATNFNSILLIGEEIAKAHEQLYLLLGAFVYQSERYMLLEFKRDHPGERINKSNAQARDPTALQDDAYKNHAQALTILAFNDSGEEELSVVDVDQHKLNFELYGVMHTKVQTSLEALRELISNYNVNNVVDKMTLVDCNMASIPEMLKAVEDRTQHAEGKIQRLEQTYGRLPTISSACMLALHVDDEGIFEGITMDQLGMFMRLLSVYARRFASPKQGQVDSTPAIVMFFHHSEFVHMIKPRLLMLNKTPVVDEHGNQKRCVVKRLRNIAHSYMAPMRGEVRVDAVVEV